MLKEECLRKRGMEKIDQVSTSGRRVLTGVGVTVLRRGSCLWSTHIRPVLLRSMHWVKLPDPPTGQILLLCHVQEEGTADQIFSRSWSR